MSKVIYECGCTAGGDLISPYCPVHTNMPIVKEIDNSTTKKHEANIMTTENKETEFDIREVPEYNGGHVETATDASMKESPKKHDSNSIYGVVGQVVRPMIQFVPTEQSTVINNYNKVVDRITELNDTTESRLADVRERMTFTKAKKTIRNAGHYFTEPYPACGEYMTTEEIKASIAGVFGA